MELPILRDFGLILAAAAAVGLAARPLRVPLIVAYIVAGLILGPATHLVHETESLELVSELGIALLLFLVGLELSLDKIRDVGRVALLAGGGQLLLTGVGGWLVAALLGFGPVDAAVLALGLTFSSTVVVVKLLQRRGAIDSTYGRIAVGILLVQDLAVAISLTFLAGLDAEAGLGLDVLGHGLLRASLGMAALVGAAVIGVRLVLPPLFAWLADSLEAMFVWSLTWCFGFILAARALGLSVEIGAFVAGVALAQLTYNHELVRRVNPLVNFFLAVFFVTLGVHMTPGEALARWPAVVGLSLFVLLGKPAILMALIPRFGYGERTSFLASLTLGQVSEFSFILASLALAAGLADPSLISVMGLVGLITIGTSAVLIQLGDRIHGRLAGGRLLGAFRAPPGPDEPQAPALRGHVIVVGMNELGRRLVHALHERGEAVLAVDVDERKLRGLPVPTLQGHTEHPSVLAAAGLADARLLVSALQIEEANNVLAYRAHQAGVPAAIHAPDAALADELRAHGATHVMVSKYDGIRKVADALHEAGVLAP